MRMWRRVERTLLLLRLLLLRLLEFRMIWQRMMDGGRIRRGKRVTGGWRGSARKKCRG